MRQLASTCRGFKRHQGYALMCPTSGHATTSSGRPVRCRAVPQHEQQLQPTTQSEHSAGQRLPQPAAAPQQPAVPPAPAAAVSPLVPAVAIDVEYTHVLLHDGSRTSGPAWVALVDEHCCLLLKTYINPQLTGVARSFGGVPLSLWASAPALPHVLQQLQALTAGKRLLGHNLAKDLAALGLNHPQALRFDTMTHPQFCNRAGNSRSLRQLAKAFLNWDIQQQPRQQQPRQQQIRLYGKARSGAPAGSKGNSQQHQQQQQAQRVQHDPEEDAAAVMRLYQQVVVPSTYEGQVAAATQQLLLEIQRRQQQQQPQQEGEGDESETDGQSAYPQPQ